jgi:hypothetical protein
MHEIMNCIKWGFINELFVAFYCKGILMIWIFLNKNLEPNLRISLGGGCF